MKAMARYTFIKRIERCLSNGKFPFHVHVSSDNPRLRVLGRSLQCKLRDSWGQLRFSTLKTSRRRWKKVFQKIEHILQKMHNYGQFECQSRNVPLNTNNAHWGLKILTEDFSPQIPPMNPMAIFRYSFGSVPLQKSSSMFWWKDLPQCYQ